MKTEIVSFLKDLRSTIICSFESFEASARFEHKKWTHHTGGGGEIGVLRGDSFEKAAVNWSGVSGPQFPLAPEKGEFFATGISLITHMKNPKAPTVHMNIRYIETKNQFWFGGGYDLTPMGFPFENDIHHFHSIAKASLEPFGKDLYPAFSKAAEEYFYIPHWKKQRGEGGIFFDHYNTGNFDQDYALWKAVGTTFLSSIIPIYKKRINESYTPEDKQKQFKARGRYVEFNLLYDRGTKFGFSSGGNPEAILCSLPPLAAW